MANNQPMEIERKYLILRPDAAALSALPEGEATEITQTYLIQKDSGFGRRIRRRGTDLRGWEYTYTRKKTVGFGERVELEDVISAEEYAQLLQEADPARHTISKMRYCFLYQKQLFELDVYAFEPRLATLEIELPAINTPVELPPFLHILRDVTGVPGYSNFALSGTLAFPDAE